MDVRRASVDMRSLLSFKERTLPGASLKGSAYHPPARQKSGSAASIQAKLRGSSFYSSYSALRRAGGAAHIPAIGQGACPREDPYRASSAGCYGDRRSNDSPPRRADGRGDRSAQGTLQDRPLKAGGSGGS